MDKCREEFEKIRGIQDGIIENGLSFNSLACAYQNKEGKFTEECEWINGAWWGWRRRQEKINDLEKQLEAMKKAASDAYGMVGRMASQMACDLTVIQELEKRK
ncbi:hypothetical protein NRA45_15115 [Acinetobacter baumannii]|uniref:hypothetical protein n=1 Tax=Acinetobacter baumannii TaxID=470 RepID=UPI00233ED7BE|nr:hypothetical protein [Acinetobacter baumannii]